MDPLTQGTLGAAAAGTAARPGRFGAFSLLGAIGGMAPDLDVLIRSDTDPLLFLEYHRQFTHALLFIPVGALLCAAVTWPVARRWLSFGQAYAAALLGYATHGVLDACTSYGTQLLWPFSDVRVAWNNVSVIDPLFTVPLLLLVIAGITLRRRLPAVVGVTWAVGYLALGALQHQRALAAAAAIAFERGHVPTRITAKPTFANLLVWKTLYLADDRFWVDGVRAGRELRWIAGDSVPGLELARDLPWLAPDARQAEDVRRFSWFSSGWVALDPADPLRVMDIRYSLLPQELRPLWGLELDPDAGEDVHARFVTDRTDSRPAARELWRMITDAELGTPLAGSTVPAIRRAGL